jgi:acyl carrier protein
MNPEEFAAEFAGVLCRSPAEVDSESNLIRDLVVDSLQMFELLTWMDELGAEVVEDHVKFLPVVSDWYDHYCRRVAT